MMTLTVVKSTTLRISHIASLRTSSLGLTFSSLVLSFPFTIFFPKTYSNGINRSIQHLFGSQTDKCTTRNWNFRRRLIMKSTIYYFLFYIPDKKKNRIKKMTDTRLLLGSRFWWSWGLANFFAILLPREYLGTSITVINLSMSC